MSAVQEIEEAVRRLSDEERAAFRAWFAEFDAKEWDRQFEADVEVCRLDWLIDEARQDLHEGALERLIQKDSVMITTVSGVVREGRVVPSLPLPEGARVEIRLADPPPDVPEDLQTEFEAWGRASDQALDLVERSAQERGTDEAR